MLGAEREIRVWELQARLGQLGRGRKERLRIDGT